MSIELRGALHKAVSGAACAWSLAVSHPVMAQTAPDARERFAHGLELAQKGELESAAVEFEAAYRISPNFAVLYNLGQAYLALGKAVEAVNAFEEYLKLGGSKIDSARRSYVQELVRTARRRIGTVKFEIAPNDAELFIDGSKRDASQALPLLAGVHGVTVTSASHQPFVGRVDVKGDDEQVVRLALDALPAPERVLESRGWVALACSVPATHLLVDGVERAGAAPESLSLGVGQHEIAWVREGYAGPSRRVEVSSDELAHATCSLRPLAKLSLADSGYLTLRVDQPHAKVQIDDVSARMTEKLPRGTHRIRVHHDGFEDFWGSVTVEPGATKTIDVHLRPTAVHAEELRRAARARRNWSYVIGGAGLAFAGVGTALYVDDTSRYDDWRRDSDSLSAAIAAQQWSPSLNRRANDLQSRAAALERRDDIALGLSAVGGALIAYAVGTWIAAHSPP